MRWQTHPTQEKLAELMGTKKSNISRLESFKSNISPRVETLMKYARATGCMSLRWILFRMFGFIIMSSAKKRSEIFLV